MTKEDVMQALARGYCSDENATKTLDSDLIMAMTAEVMLIVDEC